MKQEIMPFVRLSFDRKFKTISINKTQLLNFIEKIDYLVIREEVASEDRLGKVQQQEIGWST